MLLFKIKPKHPGKDICPKYIKKEKNSLEDEFQQQSSRLSDVETSPAGRIWK